MSKEHFTEFFNGGVSLPKTAQADNKTSFALTENELAFVNAIDFYENSFRSFMTSIVSELEEKMRIKNEEFKTIKSDFMKALAQKHNLPTKGLTLDMTNELLLINKDDGQ